MNRNISSIISFILDNFIPILIRDNKFFVYPIFWFLFKGKNIKKIMDLKKNYHLLDHNEYLNIYNKIESRLQNRKTDLSSQAVEKICNNIKKNNLNQSIIDVGHGRGGLLEILKKKGFNNLSGFDLENEFKIKEVNYQKGSLEKLPYSNDSFDTVICCHTLEHVLDFNKCISELIRICKKDLIIIVPRQRYFRYSFDLHVRFFASEAELCSAIAKKNPTCSSVGSEIFYHLNLQKSN